MRKERINEIWGVFFLLIGLFTLASLVYYHPEDLSFYTSHPSDPAQNVTGLIGAYLAFGLLITFGVSSLLIPVLFLLWSGCFFLQRVPERKFFKFIGLGIALFASSTLVSISVEAETRFDQAGVLGYLAGSHLLQYFGLVGSYILASACLLLSVLLATDFLIYPLIKRILARLQKGMKKLSGGFETLHDALVWVGERFHKSKNKEGVALRQAPSEKAKPRKEELKVEAKPVFFPPVPLKVTTYNPDSHGEPEIEKDKKKNREPSAVESPEAKAKAESLEKAAAKLKAEVLAAATGDKPVVMRAPVSVPKAEETRFDGVIGSQGSLENYQFPPVDLLKRPLKGAALSDNLQENSRILEATLSEFGIEVKVTEVEQGPVITRYELMPAPGVKVNSIAALSDDIALALKAASVRLIIPIPGKSAIGIEVPNSVASMVCLRELVESSAFRKTMQLPLALGKDTSGKTMIADLAAMPHLLIAGTTGSGKTVCVNSIIVGLLYACSPADLKFVMVDPKMVELVAYNKLPHMLTPVVTDVRKAANTLNWVVNEMENRYKLFAAVGVRNIQSFNSRPLSDQALKAAADNPGSESIVPVKLPFIVVIIDELADLMMVAQDKVEGAITRLAQLSRAVGIHLILATQRPSVDVITGVIKANFPARISFKVSSKVDSRTVLDGNGADKLLGKGDMLFMKPGDEKPTRGQAALIVDEEINGVIRFVAEQAKPEYHPEIAASSEGKGPSGPMEKDELYDEAVAVVLETGQASTSNLQRRMRLGYTRAARIIDQMEAEGLLGPSQGAKPREIYISREDRQPVA